MTLYNCHPAVINGNQQVQRPSVDGIFKPMFPGQDSHSELVKQNDTLDNSTSSIKNDFVIDCIVNGHLLDCPQNCPEEVGKIMQGCWKQQPDERMTMEIIHKHIVSLIDNVV
ncbi:NTRK1-like protein [Mya arenaria]|uniref:NTRK1-like protein n=1 Tax=Mya arenaria TaxID=6604 RepID=A0ABY7DQ80_MYAAR|nr:NTRK1-like protein [Mya arenaria]